MFDVLFRALGALSVAATALSLVPARAWWIRIWDFPRVQVAVVGVSALVFGAAAGSLRKRTRAAHAALVAAAVGYQLARVWRYTPLAPLEVQPSRGGDPAAQISLVIANVLQTNREGHRLLELLRTCDADIVLCLETDTAWQQRLDVLAETHRHVVRCPLPNTYGMLLYSRLPLEDPRVDFLIERDVPSIQARVRLRDGTLVWLTCIHPRPPAPGENDESTERDAELLLVGRRVRDSGIPVIVCGDLNDVAWSRTTRQFQRVSRLIDPRKGRGFYSTFHARLPGFRYPVDHVFHSDTFRLVAIRRLAYVGSDHFPVYIVLSYEPQASAEQEAADASGADLREAGDVIADTRGRE